MLLRSRFFYLQAPSATCALCNGACMSSANSLHVMACQLRFRKVLRSIPAGFSVWDLQTALDFHPQCGTLTSSTSVLNTQACMLAQLQATQALNRFLSFWHINERKHCLCFWITAVVMWWENNRRSTRGGTISSETLDMVKCWRFCSMSIRQ